MGGELMWLCFSCVNQYLLTAHINNNFINTHIIYSSLKIVNFVFVCVIWRKLNFRDAWDIKLFAIWIIFIRERPNRPIISRSRTAADNNHYIRLNEMNELWNCDTAQQIGMIQQKWCAIFFLLSLLPLLLLLSPNVDWAELLAQLYQVN